MRAPSSSAQTSDAKTNEATTPIWREERTLSKCMKAILTADAACASEHSTDARKR
jgi:hypothetical protein